MDRMVFTSMSGAKHLMLRQDSLAQNLANASTTGFRADLVAMRAVPARGQEAGTRVYAVETTTGSDFTAGPMIATGRDLDVAVQGAGWLTVQGLDGNESYTRAGSLQVAVDGSLQLPNGLPVLGDGGPILVPQDAQLLIGTDGTLSAKAAGQRNATAVGRLKLVNPPQDELQKQLDGMFRLKSGEPAEADPAVRVANGTLENSNVNVVDTMVGMIAASRQFEMQMKMMQMAEQNEQKASALLAP